MEMSSDIYLLGARGPVEHEGLIQRMTEASQKMGVQLQIFDAEKIGGIDQVRSALYHATRAFDEGTNSSDTLAMETLLYLAGERQITRSIQKVGFDMDTSSYLVLVIGNAFESCQINQATWSHAGPDHR